MTGLRRFISSTLLGLLCVVSQASAETVSDLYQAEVPVRGQTDEARREAVKEAFRSVLVKVTGDRDLPRRGGLSALVGRANRYVQRYGYRMLGEDDADPIPSGAVDRLLKVYFDEQAVNRRLREQGVAVWGSTRPSTLIWLGLERQGRRSLYRAETDSRLRKALEQTAMQRGLPVVFPLMDLEDDANLRVSDVWGSFEEAIRRASDRYLPDVILVGRLRQRGRADWVAEWSLYQPGEVENWRTRGSGSSKLAVEGLHDAVDRLARRYAPRYAEQGTTSLRIRVSGLENLADYVLVQEYLQSLGLIEQLDLMAARPESISFIARVQGGREALEKGIMLGGVLEPAVSEDEVVRADMTSPGAMEAESLDFRLR